MFVAVRALPSENNVTLPPRHWYTLSVAHEIFDDSDLASADARLGCLNYGQLRVYRIATEPRRPEGQHAFVIVERPTWLQPRRARRMELAVRAIG